MVSPLVNPLKSKSTTSSIVSHEPVNVLPEDEPVSGQSSITFK